MQVFSHWLSQATQPQSPYYHATQFSLFAGISYLSTATLTNLAPIKGMGFISIVYAIGQLTNPLFIKWFEPYKDVTLVPLAGQLLQHAVSVLLAKKLCNLAGHSLTFKEARLIGTVFLISLYLSRFVLFKWRQHHLNFNRQSI